MEWWKVLRKILCFATTLTEASVLYFKYPTLPAIASCTLGDLAHANVSDLTAGIQSYHKRMTKAHLTLSCNYQVKTSSSFFH